MSTQPTNTIEIDTETAVPEVESVDVSIVGEPNQSNPATAKPATENVGAPGNANGNNQSETIEKPKTPTAHDTLVEKRKQLEQQLAELDSQEKVADITDIVVELLNRSKNESLVAAKTAIDTDVQISLMYDAEKSEFRFAEIGKRMITVSPPTASTGSAKRSWFTSLTSPKNVEHVAPMKTDTSNDVRKMSEIVGFDLAKDGNGNSTSTVGKSNMLKKAGWRYEIQSTS